MKMVSFNLGREYDVITVSFDPKDTPELGAAKKEYIQRYGRPGAQQGWHFLTGQPDAINALTGRWASSTSTIRISQYAHATAIMVLTPRGKFAASHGVDFPPKDLRLGLVEGFAGQIPAARSTRDFALLLSLRSGDREVQRDRKQHFATGRRDHNLNFGCNAFHSVPLGSRERGKATGARRI